MQHYRARFTLESVDGRSVFDAALATALEWVKESVSNAKGADAANALRDTDAFCSGDLAYPRYWRGSTATDEVVAFATARFCTAGSCAWSLEIDELDGGEGGGLCRLHTCIGVLGTDERVTVNVQVTHRVRAGFFGDSALTIAGASRIVKCFMQLSGVRMRVGDIDVTNRDVFLNASNFYMMFIPELTDAERDLPLVVVATDENGDLPIENPTLLAEMLVGVAKVYVADFSNVGFSGGWEYFFRVQSAASWEYRCLPGGLKVYFPHLDLMSFDSEKSTYWLSKEQLKNLHGGLQALVDMLIDGMARFVGRYATDVLGVEDVHRIRRKNSEIRRRAKKLIAKRAEESSDSSSSHGESAEQRIEALAADNNKLRGENEEFLKIAEGYGADNDELRLQIDNLEACLAEVGAKADALEHRLNSRNAPASRQGCVLEKIPETLVDVLKLAESQWPDRIVLTDDSWKGAESWNDNEGNIQDEYAILKAVATVLYDMAIKKVPYEGELSQAFKNVTGFDLSLREGSVTKRNDKFMDKRTCVFEGKEYRMQMHVKGRNPKVGFRLYCEPDEERGVIVVGHCGHHLETAGTFRRSVK